MVSKTSELPSRLLAIGEVAELLGVPLKTIYGWRSRGEGPPGYKVGRHVKYRAAHVAAWLEQQADQRPDAAA